MQRTASAACRCAESAAAPRRVRRSLWSRRPSALSVAAVVGCCVAALALADTSKENRTRAQLLLRCGYLVSTVDQSPAIALARVNEARHATATKAHTGMLVASLDQLARSLLELVQRTDLTTKRELIKRGALVAVLQYIAHEKPTDAVVLKSAVKSLQLLLDAASESKADTDQIKVPMALLGAALNHLMDAGAMSFTELLRLGQALAECSLPSKAEPLTISFAESLQVDAEFSHAIRGFRSLLSPEMPLSLKQFGLWALTQSLTTVLRSSSVLHAEYLQPALGMRLAALLVALPHGNEQLQLQAACLMIALLQLAHESPSSVHREVYELWMKQIRYWASCAHNADLAEQSARCLEIMSSHPHSRLRLYKSPTTMAALFDLSRALHEPIPSRPPPVNEQLKAKDTTGKRQKSRTPAASIGAMFVELPPKARLKMQRHVAQAFRNICLNFKDGEAAMASAIASRTMTSPLQSRRHLPMSRVFRGAHDLTDLPIWGAEEFEASTEFGWIDIVTTWTGSEDCQVRQCAIQSLVHLTEPSEESESSSSSSEDEAKKAKNYQLYVLAQGQILQAWLMSALQHIQQLVGVGEILAVKEVEAIAKVSDELTPGNELVRFDPAVVLAGVSALAVLAEHHHTALIQQGSIPLLSLIAARSEDVDTHSQCARAVTNLVACCCDDETRAQDPDSEGELVAMLTESGSASLNVPRMLQETSSGKKFLHEMQRWSDFRDPMQRSMYYRALQNMESYHEVADLGKQTKEIYCEGVYPIVPFEGQPDEMPAEEKVTADGRDIDVVFIHGLRGHPFGTWRTDMGDSIDGDNDIWPDILLAKDLKQQHLNARIITLGYEAGMVSWSSPWPSLTLQERAKVMLHALYAANVGREKHPERPVRPVVFVTHSMGGLLAKKMLLLAQEEAQQQQQGTAGHGALHEATKGVVFLAVPHFGSDLAQGVRSEAVRSLIRAHPAIQDLCATQDGRLEALNDAFVALQIDSLSVGESLPAPLGFGLSALVVKPESADPRTGRFFVLPETDHMTICKAKRREEPLYQELMGYISQTCIRANNNQS